MKYGVLCVMMAGTALAPTWPVDNWASLGSVSYELFL